MAMDYDEEKIAIAQHCMSKPSNVSFFAGDISNFEIQPHDIFILSDMLHYLPIQKQETLLATCIRQLNAGGKILIRDGNADLEHEHKRTRLTEYLSTHIGFNKTDDMKLHFISGKWLSQLCHQNGATMKILDEGSVTSNMMFLVEK